MDEDHGHDARGGRVMVMTKGDYVFVDEKIDEEMSKVQISCSCDAVKITLFNALDWQAVAYFRREDPDLRALAKVLLACCEADTCQ